MGFHKREIQKGTYGELSKIQEELEEAFDAEEQGQDLMLLIELSDMIGAIEGVAKKYGFDLERLQKFAELRSQVAIEELEELKGKRKKYNNFTMITTSYECNKNCPYCIAKLDNLIKKKENLDAFEEEILKLKNEGYSFEYFVLSGNGEPSLYPYEDLKRIRDIVCDSAIFKDKRIQTSGNLFLEPDKFELFKDWLIEITRISFSVDKDMNCLCYDTDYTRYPLYHQARLRVNIVLLEENKDTIISTIKYYIGLKNVEVIALKILDGENKNEWINKNALKYETQDISDICRGLNVAFGMARKVPNKHIWDVGNTEKNKKITMSVNKDYLIRDEDSLYWYGDSYLDRS